MAKHFDVEDLALFLSMHRSADCLMAADFAMDHPEDAAVQRALNKFTMWMTNNGFRNLSQVRAKRFLDAGIQSRIKITLGIGYRPLIELVANCLISVINPEKGYIRFSYNQIDEKFYKKVVSYEIFGLCRRFLGCYVSCNTIHAQRLEATRIIKNGTNTTTSKQRNHR